MPPIKKRSSKEDLDFLPKVAKELGITQIELARSLGYQAGVISNARTKGYISPSLLRGGELMLENHRLKEQVKALKAAFSM